jgi:hypothetical protein
LKVFVAGEWMAATERPFPAASYADKLGRPVHLPSSAAEVARQYGIAERVLRRWKQELAAVPTFVTVQIIDEKVTDEDEAWAIIRVCAVGAAFFSRVTVEQVEGSRARDKLRALQLLARNGIGLPVTGFAHSTKDIDGLLETVGGTLEPGRDLAAAHR